jgi:hypothetical protein
VLLVVEEPEDPLVAEQLDDVPRKLVAGVDLGGAWGDPLAGECPDEIAKLALLVGQDVPGHARSVRRGEQWISGSVTDFGRRLSYARPHLLEHEEGTYEHDRTNGR